MNSRSTERRSNPRIEINGRMTYRKDGSEDIYQGKLENLSMQGARIWIDQELPTASQLVVRVETDEQETEAMEFKATVLHMLPDRRKSLYGYGCSIDESSCPELSVV